MRKVKKEGENSISLIPLIEAYQEEEKISDAKIKAKKLYKDVIPDSFSQQFEHYDKYRGLFEDKIMLPSKCFINDKNENTQELLHFSQKSASSQESSEGEESL